MPIEVKYDLPLDGVRWIEIEAAKSYPTIKVKIKHMDSDDKEVLDIFLNLSTERIKDIVEALDNCVEWSGEISV